MPLQTRARNSLQQRVNSYLRSEPTTYAREESGTEATEVIIGMLQKAEAELETARRRVERLKWELAKTRS